MNCKQAKIIISSYFGRHTEHKGTCVGEALDVAVSALGNQSELLAEIERLTAENAKLKNKINRINDRAVAFMECGPFEEKESFSRIHEIYGLSKEEQS